MRKFILPVLLLFSFTDLCAQKEFQGAVTYLLHSDSEKKDAELNVLFAPGKLKLRFKDYAKDTLGYDKEELIVWLDSGKIYTVNTVAKSYTEKYLKIKKTALRSIVDNKKIVGYNTTPLQVNGVDYNDAMGMLSSASITYYIPDSLYFTIPEKYKGNLELIMIQNNRIVLGADVKLKTSVYDEAEKGDSLDKEDLRAEAIKVEPGILDSSVFAIPAGFENAANITYEPIQDPAAAIADSIATTIADSVPAKRPIKKTAKKKPVKSSSTKAPVKSSAVKRKQ